MAASLVRCFTAPLRSTARQMANEAEQNWHEMKPRVIWCQASFKIPQPHFDQPYTSWQLLAQVHKGSASGDQSRPSEVRAKCWIWSKAAVRPTRDLGVTGLLEHHCSGFPCCSAHIKVTQCDGVGEPTVEEPDPGRGLKPCAGYSVRSTISRSGSAPGAARLCRRLYGE